jgi:hypothetical protein
MKSTCATRAVLALLLAALAAPWARAGEDWLVVHEWGTFTSVAGADGRAMTWQPFSTPSDLPCFVEHEGTGSEKGGIAAQVRMETPVLYFYAPRAMTVSAAVRFPHGLITEWYPHGVPGATAPAADGSLRAGAIAWPQVTLSPGAAPDLHAGSAESHYYAARAVDAAPLAVGEEQEKFLFYRGVGDFALPLEARIEADGAIRVWNSGPDNIPSLFLVERRGPAIGYRALGALSARQGATIAPPSLDGDVAALEADVERALIGDGLYAREAKAMVATWRQSWFEEGARLFYLVPRPVIDTVLPLAIDPPPAAIVRAFIGRLELATPATEAAIADAVAREDLTTLRRYARFLTPLTEPLARGHPGHAQRIAELSARLAAEMPSAARCIS